MTTTAPNVAPAPCPFCGGEAQIDHDKSRVTGNLVYFPSCLDSDCPAFIVGAYTTYPTHRQAITAWNTRTPGPALAAENARLIAENADLKQSVIAFCGPWAAQWAEMCGLSKGTLQDGHYDLLEKCGARLVDFTRQTPRAASKASAS